VARKTTPRGLGRVKDAEALQAPTLVGDVRDLVLQEMRDAKDALPWTTRTEKQQQEMIDRVDRFARNLVASVIQVVASEGRPSVSVLIEKWEVSKGLKLVAKGVDTEENISTMMHGGKSAFIVFGQLKVFEGEREPVRPAPDQPELGDDDDTVFDQTDAGR
jgi:hypothetical protein